MTKSQTDIILVGGGLTAKCTAVMLYLSGYSFRWTMPHQKKNPRDSRTTTIHDAGMKMLSALGVWNQIAETPCPINKIAVAHGRPSERCGQKDWPLCWNNDRPAMAHVVHNALLSDALDTVYCGPAPLEAEIIRLERNHDVTTLTVANGQTYDCSLAIASDGASSKLRKLAGLKSVPLPVKQTAIVSVVSADRPLQQTAYQRFLTGGPLAIMPTGDYEGSLVWSLPDDVAQNLSRQTSEEVSAYLNSQFGPKLGRLTIRDEILLWPLRPAFVPAITSPGLIIVGDAAHTLHPLAGMGVNLALADIAELADCLGAARRRGLQPGHPSVRKHYANQRRTEISALTALTQSLNWLFSPASGPLSEIAGLGFAVLNTVPLKNKLKQTAMGGRLSKPSLFRGQMPF